MDKTIKLLDRNQAATLCAALTLWEHLACTRILGRDAPYTLTADFDASPVTDAAALNRLRKHIYTLTQERPLCE